MKVVKGTWSLRNQVAGEGPIVVGIANGDLSVTEVQEKLDAAPSRRDDIIAIERMSRPIRQAGTFPGTLSKEVLNQGLPIVISKLPTKGWQFNDNISLALWGQNQSGATMTGSRAIVFSGIVGGNWI